jgi:SulP family sulfate permease
MIDGPGIALNPSSIHPQAMMILPVLLQRCLNALAYANVGNIDELRRCLDAPEPPPRTATAAANPQPFIPPAAVATFERVTRSLATFRDSAATNLHAATGRWVQDRHHTFHADLIAGLTVTLVAIPQSLAYAQLAGVPAYYGLYAAFLPTIVAAMIGSLPQLSTGPAALTALLTAASIAPLAAQGSESFIANVVLLALIAGVFQILFGMMRLGVLLNFLSHPVLMGFINAAALIIGLSQLPALLGIPSGQSEYFLADIWQLLTHLNATHGVSLAFGITAIAMLMIFKRFTPRFPGVLLTVIVLTIVSAQIDYAGMGGDIVGAVPSGMPSFSLPTGNWATVLTLLPAGFVLALISFMEATSSAKVIAIKTRQHWDENRELVAQGLAKVASALSHSIPVSASFSRSALNTSARTRMAAVIAALGVLLTMLFFTSLLYHVPKPALAAIIMVAVVGLIDLRAIGTAWRANRDDGLACIITFVATLAFAPYIQNGIITGILLSLGLLLYRMMRPRVAVLGLHPEGELLDAKLFSLPPPHPRIGAVRFDGSLHFVTGSYFEEALVQIERGNPDLRYVLVKSGGINDIDASGIEVLRSLGERFRKNGVTLAFSELKRQVRDVLDRTGLTEIIGSENFFPSDKAALRDLNRRLAESSSVGPASGEGTGVSQTGAAVTPPQPMTV